MELGSAAADAASSVTVNVTTKTTLPNPNQKRDQIAKDRLVEYLSRIERAIQGAAHPDKTVHGLRLLMSVSQFFGVIDKAEKCARQLLQINPEDAVALAGLERLLADAKRDEEAHQVARDFWQKAPSAQSAYVCARSLAKRGQNAEAEKILRTRLEKVADDFGCVVALGAFLLKTRESAEALEEAQTLLEQAQRVSGVDADGKRKVEYDYYRAIYLALSGDTVLAHLKLLRLQSENPDDDRITKALSAFKR